MPGQICAVASCESNRLTLQKEGVHLIFHSFPKDSNLISSTMRKEWIKRCKRHDKFNPSTSVICSLHFTPNDYERDLRNELLGLPLRRVLKKTAVPALGCKNMLKRENSSEKLEEKPFQTAPPAKRARKKINKDPSALSMSTAGPSSDTEISDRQAIPTPDAYKKKYEDLFIKYNTLKLNNNRKIKELNSMLKYYKVKCYNQSINKQRKKKGSLDK